MKFVLLTLILLILVICCESSVDPYSLTTNIVGTVTEMGSGLPLDSTTVLLMAKHKRVDGQYSYHRVELSRTNKTGYYEIRAKIDNGIDHYLQAVRSGYHPVYAFEQKIYVRYREHQTINIHLSKGS